MALSIWTQDNFSKGELSPLMYARTSVKAYFDGLKIAKNIITFPQGAAGKRFGTNYLNTVNVAVTDTSQIRLVSFQYLAECTYVLLFRPGKIDVYLEGTLNDSVTIGLTAEDIQRMDTTVLRDRLRITYGYIIPKELVRGKSAASAITGFSAPNKTLTIAIAQTIGEIFPCRFTGTVPILSPIISINHTYFSKAITTTTIQIFPTAVDAKNNTNAYEVASAGGPTTYVKYNLWQILPIAFQNVPVFDFQDLANDYNTRDFNLSVLGPGKAVLAISGAAYFTTAWVNGAFIYGAGVARLLSVATANTMNVEIIKPFSAAILAPALLRGSFVFLAEPAWSTARGFPKKCSSFQNRAVFANTESLPNGLWLSAINDFEDFSEITTDDEDAIAYYPTSGDLNTIEHLTPYRSLAIHTNNGFYSTPLNLDVAITPTNFSLSIQDTTPAGASSPVPIDNQIILMAGNDAYSMLWDGINNAYTSTMISAISEQLITNPIEMAAFSDLTTQGSRYLIVINEDGNLAIYQTMISEEVSGWTPAYAEQSYGEAYYRHIASNFDGRAWFVVERQLATADVAGDAITAINDTTNTITGTALGLTIGSVIQVTFATTGTLPTTVPQIVVAIHYWIVGITADEFAVYSTKADAIADTSRTLITAVGTTSTVTSFPLVTNFIIEELDFNSGVDCATNYNGGAIGNITGVPRFNGQETTSSGDGYGYASVGYGDNVYYTAHGIAATVSIAQTGFPINVAIQPMPLSIAMGNNSSTSNVLEPKHIRSLQLMFSNTFDGEVNGIPIALKTFEQVDFGVAPQPVTGTFQMSLMKGWNEFKYNSISITHSSAFDMKLIGLFYKVEV
ncbi:MAG: hypothetical protein QNK36_10505 [Colwellia sp.]|nr:hypothetical protein [Colwellia sp.]